MCGFMSVCGTDLPLSVFKSSFHSIAHRGPDASKCVVLNDGIMGFHRLAIMGLSEKECSRWNGMEMSVYAMAKSIIIASWQKKN